MVITQTVEIPASRRLIIDVPPEIPEGLVVLMFAPMEVRAPLQRDEVSESDAPYHRLLGCHKALPNGTVDDFLAHCREDKEREMAIEERQQSHQMRW
jgi:hypothetical protein